MNEHDEARDLMRRLVAVANEETLAAGCIEEQETFMPGEESHQWNAIFSYDGKRIAIPHHCPLRAVRVVVSTTPWAGRIL